MRKQLLGVLFFFSTTGVLAADPVSTGFFSSVAIDGHDTVQYHTPEVRSKHAEIQGEKRFAVEWKDAKWLFASQASADKFAASPEQYVPLYNGHCSNALSLGEGLVTTDGTVWEFFGEKLHLFYAERGRQRWLNGDWKAYKVTADEAWEELRK
jgi:hypothetical protein